MQGAPSNPQVAASVDYLRQHYHVGAAEAVRRLALQQAASNLQGRLIDTMPDRYAGMWLDQEHGGVLVVAATDPAAVRPALAALPDAGHVTVRQVSHSWRELSQAATALRARLGAPTDSVTIDEVSNRVVLRAAPSTLSTLAAQPSGVTADPALVAVEAPAAVGETTACDVWTCPSPLRGGVAINMYNGNTNTGYYCTLGFNVRGSNGWLYTVTAGHCLTTTGANQSKHNGLPVGYEVMSKTSGNYPVDGTIMPFVVSDRNYASYWQPRGWVIDYGNDTYPIRGMYNYDQINTGWVACTQGVRSGTACGHVVGKDGGIVMDICRLHGDSGGPLYSEVDQRAYGVQNWVNTNGESCPSGAQSHYTALSSIFNYSWNSDHSVTFSVLTG